jgi:hypothetical protein
MKIPIQKHQSQNKFHRGVIVTFHAPRRLGLVLKFIGQPKMRYFWALSLVVFLFTELVPILGPTLTRHAYALNSVDTVLPEANGHMGDLIKYDVKSSVYNFNAGYNPAISGAVKTGGSHISAKLSSDAGKGITVTDPVSGIDFTVTPQFSVVSAQKQQNRVVYPLANGSGWLVYSLEADQVKENIALSKAPGDSLTLKYKLDLSDGLVARLQHSGDIGIFGSSLPLNGNISTGTPKDAQLLQKARTKAPKDKLLFIIPAPVVNEANKTKSSVQAHYELQASDLTLSVTGLKKASYPLSIDPSVYVTSAAQFMRGNNESNVDFDTTNNLIQKSKLTGARIPSWTTDTALNSARWSAGYAAGGGYAYVVGGNSGGAGTATNTVYWAQFSLTDNTIDTPPNPGTGATGCNSSNWCTNSTYNLPATRSALSTVVYNGYIYAIGGTDAGCVGTNNVCSTVYYSKIGANGEPIGWNSTAALGTARRFAGAVAYNNKLYVVGGQTNTTLIGDTSIEAANILPNGTLGAFSTTGMTAIPTAGRWGMTVLQNNGYLYLIGGASTTTTAATVQYIKIKSDGTLDAWVSTSSFANARAAFGGTFATIYGGYMYITSGCTTLTATSCTTFTSTTNDFQLASINADGSITGFTAYAVPLMSATSTAMTGYGLLAWRGALYGIGGCTALTAAATCSGVVQTQAKYGTVNSDGDVSTVQALNALPTNGTAAGQGGRIAMGVVINNGYIYVIGGCSSNPTSTTTCTTMSPNTSYSAINSDGTLSLPAGCNTATLVASTTWCVDSTAAHQINTTTGLGAFGVTVYNNTIYTVGGRTGGSGTDQNLVCRDTLSAANGALGTFSCAAATGITAGATIFTFARAQPNNGTNGYLYAIGGCTSTGNGIGCNTYLAQVVRCTITNAGGAPSSCATTGQLQLFTGTGIFGGAVYGDYIYLAGGANSLSGATTGPTGVACTSDANACGGQLDIIQYAFVNSSGAITRTDGTTTTGGWHIASSRLTHLRRRTTAFAINGYLYVVAGHDGSNAASPLTLTDIQRGKINVTTGDVTGFTALATTITARWDMRAAQANGYIYILGGCTTGDPPAACTAMNGVSEFVQVYNNWSGSPASYTSSANVFTTDRYGASATVLNGYLYIAGGCTTSTDCSSTTTGTATNDISFAPLNADGSIGTWTTATNLMTTDGTTAAPRVFGKLENVGGTLYYVGGQISNATPQSTVLYSTPSAVTGQPVAWASATNALPAARSQLDTAVYNGRIYATGGFTAANATPSNVVYYSPDLTAGGNIGSAWTTDAGTSFQLARSGHNAVAYGNNLYVMGGFDGTNYLLDVQYAPIAADGSIGAWNYTMSLPQTVRQGGGFAVNGYMYVFGGRSAASTCTSNTYVAPINADGSFGAWSQTSVAFSGTRWGVTATYDGGRAYVLGGICGTTFTTTNRSVYGTLQMQPQLANYSLMIDTDIDVFPAKYLINGLDNGIGAAWFLNYQSSTDTNNSWGILTNAGKVGLGTPGTYIPLDGSGTNTNATVGARYYMLFLKIDDQQAFGFPEDITRGPNIYDLTLEFSSNPSKRLRNGKTFVGGVQQPLDTPF